MTKLLFVINFVVLCANFVFGQICTTPNNINGQCVILTQCPTLLNLALSATKTSEDVMLLQNSFCGKEGDMVKVCCPTSKCITPENTTGDCIGVLLCPNMAERIKTRVSAENRAYVASAICQSSVPFSVCCDLTSKPVTPSLPSAASRINICSNNTIPQDPSTGCCGRESRMASRIINGVDAAIDQFPWMALIEYDRLDKNKNPLQCGGSLISARYVLTAAHCISDRAVTVIGPPKLVRLGEYDTNSDGEDCVPAEGGGQDCTYGVVKINIETYTPHPEYNALSGRNDIGLIRMEKKTEFNEFITPICLPTSDITLYPSADLLFYISGWGRTDDHTEFSHIKQYANVTFVNSQECQLPYKQNGIRLSPDVICAGSTGGQDTCKGDSGGPLMYEKDQIYEVTGVVNFGPKPCGQANFPGVYAKVYSYRDWILRTIVE